jgi:membrane fusion protein (multidrug efflux system)
VRARREASGKASTILPGSFARVEIPAGQNDAMRLPTQAVVQSARGAQVWRVRGGLAELAVFQPGARDANMVEVVSGLNEGDTVLVSGLLQLRPGTAVIPVVER